MHLPRRARGLVLGFTMLVGGPLTAMLVSTAPPELVSAPAAYLVHVPIGAVDRAGHLVSLPKMLRLHSPIPPMPAQPKPAPRIQRSFVPPHFTASQAQVIAIIMAAAARYGVSGSWMVSIASCESGLRPNAYNSHGPYYGLFQFLMSTFTHNGGTNIWDPTDQANIAAKMLAHGQAYQWSCA